MSDLFPVGVTHLADVPYTLHDAIVRALMFLAWEELPKEERPPRRIWTDGDDLVAWFKEVERRREEKYGTSGSGSTEIEDPVDNEAARSLVVG